MQAFLKKVVIQKQINPADFLKFFPSSRKKELLKQAARLRGKRIVHVNAVENGGGVAELLLSLIPYLRSLGIESDWYYINPEIGKSFFEVTNKIHNALQSADIKINDEEWAEYEYVGKLIAGELNKIDCDILAINDPQLLFAGCQSSVNKNKVYFSHIDTSSVFKPVWKKILPFISSYRRIVFSNWDFVNNSLPRHKIKVFTPAIDPLAPKQKIVPRKEARRYLKKSAGIPIGNPLITQISRFDIWKNPIGVIQAFRMVKSTYPNALLALVGFNLAKDNPAADVIYKDIAAIASKAEDIFLFFDSKTKDALEFTVMMQNASDVIVQNSTKEGFGLTVTEAMWKCQPVVGGSASGIRKQIQDGKNGFITKTSEELAEKITFLLSNPKKKRLMGRAAKKAVLEKFLFPRLVLDHINLYLSCLK